MLKTKRKYSVITRKKVEEFVPNFLLMLHASDKIEFYKLKTELSKKTYDNAGDKSVPIVHI